MGPEPDTTTGGCFRQSLRDLRDNYKFVLALAGGILLFSFGIGFLFSFFILLATSSEEKFTVQINLVEAKLAAASSSSSYIDYSKAPSLSLSSSSEPGLGLDFNVTLSVITKEPITFNSLLVLLAHDNDKSILASKMVDGFYQRSTGQLKVEMADVRVYPRKEDNNIRSDFITLTLKVVGQYWALVEGQQIHKSDLKITCKGIKIALPSSSNDVTNGGALHCSKSMYVNQNHIFS